jgi:hypothetical protein
MQGNQNLTVVTVLSLALPGQLLWPGIYPPARIWACKAHAGWAGCQAAVHSILGNLPGEPRFKRSPGDYVARSASFIVAPFLECEEADEWTRWGLDPGPPAC